ncbi:hypothetical protein VB638_07890 [Dolichospermum sp. UHCC 0684]|jgi:hypothetical protein|uniref:hypothetical protein n=1 Tax=unclassified Dolichospermum TaxID=2622029 RepID=UPI0014455B56|nr:MULTISPECIES: hypothetical protein [unclassified Dolichospermum]MEA5529509.1 hypothetical protein [Dolichospermum sp. UHCC 0684]MTJ36280.1 hypothetical protein [Dolichospermum sp. UHCC 0260]
MQLIYNVLDGLVAMKQLQRFFAILGLFVVTSAALGSVYFLFRTYNYVGLGVLLFIFQILVPRDSILERIEMRKIQEQEKQAQANTQVSQNA